LRPVALSRQVAGAVRRVRNRLLNLIDPAVFVLIYHRVTTLPSDPQRLAVSPENFRSQLKFLKDRFPIVKLEEDWSGISRPAISITFDDGYQDNFSEALPILEEVGVPATFFVSTENLGSSREYWWDELERILLKEGHFPANFSLEDQNFGRTWPTSAPIERDKLYRQLLTLMKPLDPVRRTDWLGQLRHWGDKEENGRGAYRAMTVEELRQLAASRWVTIGAHTITHSRLSSLSADRQQEEILSSKRQLEELLGGRVKTFSYPYGRKADYNRSSIDVCREAGFLKAAANFPGEVRRWTDPFQLPRHLVRNWDLPTFMAELKIKGIWPL